MADFYHQRVYGYGVRVGGITVHHDIELAEPSLSFPANRAILCRNVSWGDQTVVLTWTHGASVDVDTYVVQWCENSQFTGPTLKGERTASTTLTLNLSVDVQYGRTYFWRVMAYNNVGGASPKSDVREFKIQCVYPTTTDGGSDDLDEEQDCIEAGVSIEISSKTVVNCDETFLVHANVKGEGTLDSVSWAILSGDASIISSDTSAATLSAQGCESQDIELEYSISLDQGGGVGIIVCKKRVSIRVECDTEASSISTTANSSPQGSNASGSSHYLHGGAWIETFSEYSYPCGANRNRKYEHTFVQFPNLGSGLTMTGNVLSADADGGVSLSDDDPEDVGVTDSGVSEYASRSDHVHGGGGGAAYDGYSGNVEVMVDAYCYDYDLWGTFATLAFTSGLLQSVS